MADGVKQQQRRGLEADWVLTNYILDAGELGISLDTGVIKFGDGVNGWTDLPIAFADYYLPKLGTAANSELLEGISADGFLKFNDTDVDPDPNKIAQRDENGRLNVVAGVSGNQAINFSQIAGIKGEVASRSVTTNATLALGDIGAMILVDHASTTAYVTVTVPLNSSVAIPVGSWFDICVVNAGGVKIVAAGGVTIGGTRYVHAPYGVVRLLKVGTDGWIAMNIGGPKKQPKIRVYRNTGGQSLASNTDVAIQFNATDAANTYNPGDEWFSIPPAGLPTARRVVINQDGDYHIMYNASVTSRSQSWAKLFKLTADNVLGTEIAASPAFWNGQAVYRGRLTAGESVGGVYYYGTTGGTTDEADGLAGHRHDLTIVRVGD